jgi:hypothetical protein
MSRPYNILTDKMQSSITTGGRTFPLVTRTAVAIDCILKLGERDVPEDIKFLYITRRLLTGDAQGYPPFSVEVMDAVTAYLYGPPKSVEEPTDEDKEKEQDKKLKPRPQVFDYQQDAGAVVAAFQQAYGMTLSEVRELHWWHFLTLFAYLPQEQSSRKSSPSASKKSLQSFSAERQNLRKAKPPLR